MALTKTNSVRPSNKTALIIAVVVALGVVGTILYLNFFSGGTVPIEKQASVSSKVSITADGFSPDTINVTAGSQITWTNTDTAVHELGTGPAGNADTIDGFDHLQPLSTNDTYSFVMEKSGTYHYFDVKNPTRIGTIIVK